MKNEFIHEKNTVTESVLDPIRKTRCTDLFDKPDDEKPVIKREISDMIKNAANKFIRDIDIPGIRIEQLFIVGSSLGFQYRDDSDIDVDMRINISKKQLEGKYYLIPKGLIVPGTEHPINLFILTTESPEYNFDKDAENAYDVLTDTWIKQSQLSNINEIPYAYLSGVSEFIMDGMTLQLQRAERDIRELNKYLLIDPNKVAISEKEKDEAISRKISDLLIDKDALNLAHRFMFKMDDDGFHDDPISVSIDYKYEARHFSMNNLIYKYIDSFKYYDKINDMIKQIDSTIKHAQDEIKKDSAEQTPEGENKEMVQQEIEQNISETNVEESYTDEQLKEILVENGYESSDKNLRIIKRRLNEKYFIVDSFTEEDQILSEDLRSRTENYLNKKIVKASGKWSSGARAVLGWLFAGLVGAVIMYQMSGSHNDKVEGREAALYDEVDNDSECNRIINEIKNELNNEKPNKQNLKSLKKEYAFRINQLSKKLKAEENQRFSDERRISLK